MIDAREIVEFGTIAMFTKMHEPENRWQDFDEETQSEYRDGFRAGLLAVLVKMEESTEAVTNAIIAAVGADDDRSGTEMAVDVWIAGCRALRAEIEAL